jgi:hypothetical protein
VFIEVFVGGTKRGNLWRFLGDLPPTPKSPSHPAISSIIVENAPVPKDLLLRNVQTGLVVLAVSACFGVLVWWARLNVRRTGCARA